MKKKLLLGLMAMTLPLSTWAAFDVTLGKSTITYNGTQTKPEITVKDGSNTLVEGTDYALVYKKKADGAATTLTNVGEYTVTVQGLGATYGAQSVNKDLTVEPKVVTELTLKAFEKPYGTTDAAFNLYNAKFITVTPADIAPGDTEKSVIDCLQLVRVGTDASNQLEDAGEYLVTVEPKTGANNNYSYEPKGSNNVTMTITKKELKVTSTAQTYKGVEILPSEFNPQLDGLVTGDVITVTFEKNTTNQVIKDAGDYTVKVKYNDPNDKLKNYTYNTTAAVKVKKADLKITPKTNATLTKVFGKSDPNLTDQFDFAEWKDNTHETVTMERKDAENEKVGTYEINPVIKDKDGNVVTELKNYVINYPAVPTNNPAKSVFEITPKYLTGNDITVTIDREKRTYQGHDFIIPEGLVTIKYFDTELTSDDVDIEIVNADPEKPARNAGDKFGIKITAKEDGNYAGALVPKGTGNVAENITAITDVAILKAPLEITLAEGVEELTKVYDGEDISSDDLQAKFNIPLLDEDIENQAEIVKMVKNAGKDVFVDNTTGEIRGYWVRVHKVNADGTTTYIPEEEYKSPLREKGLANYEITFDAVTYTITPKPLTYSIANAEKVYNGKTTTPAFTIESDDVVDADKKEDGSIDLDKVFTTKPTISVKDGKKADVGIYTLYISNLAKVASKNYAITEDSYVEGENKYEITKAPLTITVLDQELEYSAKGDIKFDIDIKYNKDADVEGETTVHIATTFVDADKEAIEAALNDVEVTYADGFNAQMVGVWPEALILDIEDAELTAALNNFEVTTVPGTLTVTGVGQLILDRDGKDDRKTGPSVKTLLEAYNGQENMTVTLGGNRNLQANYWYTLVLPFEATVREISKAFGYAVVDVPDESNTDAGKVAFKLKVDAEPIPANTLILIKIDQAINLGALVGDEDEVKFDGKTIDYAPEYFTKDAAGNEYHGVYENMELKEDGYWYLSGGNFWNAGAYYRTYGVPVSISALGGYVYAVAGAAARIFVEEADGSTTSINAVTGETTNSADSWYSVDGMKLNAQPTQKGVYINNGKKVVIK